jgi:hypothetical protein
MKNQQQEVIGEIYVAWDEDGVYVTSRSEETAPDDLQSVSEARLFRVKRYEIPMFLPVCEEEGELDPPI